MSAAARAAPASVAICIPTYNQAEYLRRAVASALAQDHDGPVEVWVADDASTDDTSAVLDELQRRHPGLNVVRQPSNLGIAENTSSLLARPTTELVVRLDSDDELLPAYVSTLARLMDDASAAGYAHSAVEEIDEHGHVRRIRELIRGTGFQDGETALRASLSGYRTTANIVMFRRTALAALSYYVGRPEFVEDYDLAVRMADAGYGNVYCDAPLARYRVWNDAAGMRARRKALQLRGYRRIFDEAFAPAWRRRGWDERDLTRRRQALACQNCASCFEPQHAPGERAELVALLWALGPSRELEVRIRLCRLGLARQLAWAGRLWPRVKNRLKPVVRWARALRHR